MKVEVKGKDLIITLPIEEPRLSPTGKTMMVATSHGNIKTGLMVRGKELIVGVNAYTKAEGSPTGNGKKGKAPAEDKGEGASQ